MPHATLRVADSRVPLPCWDLLSRRLSARDVDSSPAVCAAPAIDDNAAAIDELAFVLATDHWSTLEKIWLLEQWRYDTLLLELAGGEGFAAEPNDAALLQQINKALLQLGPYPSGS